MTRDDERVIHRINCEMGYTRRTGWIHMRALLFLCVGVLLIDWIMGY